MAALGAMGERRHSRVWWVVLSIILHGGGIALIVWEDSHWAIESENLSRFRPSPVPTSPIDVAIGPFDGSSFLQSASLSPKAERTPVSLGQKIEKNDKKLKITSSKNVKINQKKKLKKKEKKSSFIQPLAGIPQQETLALTTEQSPVVMPVQSAPQGSLEVEGGGGFEPDGGIVGEQPSGTESSSEDFSSGTTGEARGANGEKVDLGGKGTQALSGARSEPKVEDAIFDEIRRRFIDASQKCYPKVARRRGIEGVSTIRFCIDESGAPSNFSQVQSSGSPLLDGATSCVVAQASPFPKSAVGKCVVLPIRFRLR